VGTTGNTPRLCAISDTKSYHYTIASPALLPQQTNTSLPPARSFPCGLTSLVPLPAG
jgi:hypothetical protein